jgi:single-strand DNA-binding protein
MLNHISIMGRLTKDPELRRTGTGTAVASFTLAVDRDFSKEKETDFIECVAWAKTAEFVSNHFSKGKMAIVAGRLQIRSWTDKDGNKRRTAEVVADNVYFGDSSKKDSQNGAAPAEYTTTQAPAEYTTTQAPAHEFALLDDDDQQLPF